MDIINKQTLIKASPYSNLLDRRQSSEKIGNLRMKDDVQDICDMSIKCLKYISSLDKNEQKSYKYVRRELQYVLMRYINFELPKYKVNYERGSEWYRCSALYARSGNIHTDRRLTFLPRTTQGLTIPITYISEAITAVASAFSYYLMYRSGKNAYHAIKEHTYGIQSAQVLSTLKTYFLEIFSAIRIIYSWYVGQITTDQALLMVLGLGGWIASKHYLLSAILPTLKPVPANSTTRETQAFDPPTLTQNILSILILLGLGSGSTLDAKTILNSIKSLSASLLTVRTVENVFINIVTYLPDIIQLFICDTIPAFGLYIHMTTNTTFRRFVEVSHELMGLSVSDIFFNSHNFSKFLRYHDICATLCRSVQFRKIHIHNLIPEIISWYDRMYCRSEELGLLPGRRKMPYVIWLSGDPGIGKSTMVKEIANHCIGHLFRDATPEEEGTMALLREQEIEKYIYTHNTSNKFFDGYHNQPIFVLNDYLQFAQEKEEQWLIRFVDTNECPLEVSSVDNPATGVKGEVRFTSRVIIVTSNVPHLCNSPVVTNLDAFNRRRDFVANLKWKEGFNHVDFDEFDYKWCDFTRLPAMPYGHNLVQTFQNKESLLSAMMRDFDKYILRSGKMNLDHVEETRMPTIKSALAAAESFDMKWDSMIWNTWKEILKFADKTYFGIPLKYLLPLVVGGASATYAVYKSWVPSLVGQMASQSLSGDMATQRLQRKTKQISRMTMGDRQNNTELAFAIMNNMVRITTIIKDPSDRLITQVVWGWSYGGTFIITPKHLWKRGKSQVQTGDSVSIERGGVVFDFKISEQNLYLFENEDLAVINVFGFAPPFKNKENLILDEHSLIDEAGEDSLLIMPTQTGDKYAPVLIPLKSFLTDAPYTDEYGVVYEGRNIWQYNHRLVKGDCGVPMLIKTKQGMKVAGIHVAGDAFSGNSEVITSGIIREAENYFSVKHTQGFCSDAVFEEEEFFDAESDLDGNFFYLGRVQQPPYQKSETQIVKSPLFEVLQPHLTEPAVLSPTDKRMTEICSPIIKSVSKYGQPVPPFDSLLMSKAFEIVTDMYSPLRNYKLKVFSHEDAVNAKYTPNLEKLDLTTSAGYPWNTKGVSKQKLFDKDKDGNISIKDELKNVINRNENLLSKRTMFPYTLVTTLKDERVSLEKVKIGKTRTFMNFPVEYTVSMRRYFDDFIDKETKHALEIGTTVGVNIYSTQWHNLFLDLHEFEYVTDGDFKAFDGTIRPEFFRLYAQLVNSFYRDEYSNHRFLLCNGCCFAPMFVLNKVYVKLQGNPSGSRLTTSFNSFVNRMYVVMSMLSTLPEHMHNKLFFRENVKIFAHGDDHIIGFSALVREFWDALVMRSFMKHHNIDYTSSSKNEELKPHRPLNECYYLKSHFVYNKTTGMYQAGLDKTVIQEMVSWQRDNTLESTEMIVQTALRYAYFWGREYFDQIYDKILQAVVKQRLNIKLIDFDSLEQYYLYNGQMEFSYN